MSLKAIIERLQACEAEVSKHVKQLEEATYNLNATEKEYKAAFEDVLVTLRTNQTVVVDRTCYTRTGHGDLVISNLVDI